MPRRVIRPKPVEDWPALFWARAESSYAGNDLECRGGCLGTGLAVSVPAEAARYLVYLTPRESLAEVEDSAARVDEPARDRPRLFRLQWQDLLEAADAAWPGSPRAACTILADVGQFLREVGLEYFKGMSRIDELPLLDPEFGTFYAAGLTGFRGMTRDPVLDLAEVCKGRWS